MISPILSSLLLQVSAPVTPPREADGWKPWLSWTCQVREGDGKPYIVNGFIAQRYDPTHPDEGMRYRRAFKVARDDSGVLSGLWVRSPLFVVAPNGFWALYPGEEGKRPKRFLVLRVKQPGGNGSIEISTGKPGTKPFATGPCATRVDAQRLDQ